ncbi:conserved hypothetical protein [Candidatus Sulfopaludibacter sp. SbA3]|nr:conserved hypothetical protein [Candidatus Sulfopaludibacter sp. SbA3]
MMTIGHSNRSLADLIAMLQAHGVQTLVDVRTVPKSRYNPQFNRDALPVPLATAGIQYLHMPGLGGLRHARKDSLNTAWRNDSFRGYADYMQTAEFARSLDELIAIPGEVALMCAESVPWRCHRSMIADALAARGIPVWHIMSTQARNPHKVTAFAHVEGEQVTYPGEVLKLFE